MSWARLDDRYHDNRKIKRAWRDHPRAVGLHAMAVTYSSMHETDGMVDIEWLQEKLPKPKEREAVIATLVNCALFEAVDGERFLVHDYLDYNPSRSALEDKRAKDSERKAKGRSNRNPNGIHTDSTRTPNGRPDVVRAESARPVPARPGTTEGQT